MVIKGQKINNRYEIIRIIGEGGMANVYLAEDTILNRKVAVKVLRGDLANDEKFVRRFQREALSASSLSHPNIVEMYDVGEDDGNFYIVMEYVEGKNLKQLLKKRGKLNINEVIDIMLQLTDGLAHAHDSYIIHRDIKPQNILILDNGLVKITDFGIAMALNSSQLTQTNSVMGSVHYLPPEQANGKGSTIKSDVYSLGILMYELISGSLPFRGENAVEIALKHIKEKIPYLKKEHPDLPQSIENIILKSCAKNPKNRYADAREMYNDLKVALDEENQNVQRYIYPHKEEELEETKAIEKVKSEDKEKPEIKKIEEDPKKKNKKIIILISVISFLLLLVLFLLLILPRFTKVPDVRVPDVSNMTVQEAEEKLKEVGFEVALETEKTHSDIVEEGLIIRTSPAIGRIIKQGTTIKLYESLGSEKIKIEDYTDQNINQVKARLELLGLEVTLQSKNVDNVEDYKDKEDNIIDQDPKTGDLNKGDQIILYYPNIVVYPDMIGWNISEVQEFTEKYELNLIVREQETNDEEEGTVLEQGRRAGTTVIRRADFSVTVAKPIPIIEEEENEDSN